VQQEVEWERSRLKTILDTLPVGVSVADVSGEIILRNKFMFDYLGKDAGSKDLTDLALFPGVPSRQRCSHDRIGNAAGQGISERRGRERQGARGTEGGRYLSGHA
jgi:PAS domain-containing protein